MHAQTLFGQTKKYFTLLLFLGISLIAQTLNATSLSDSDTSDSRILSPADGAVLHNSTITVTWKKTDTLNRRLYVYDTINKKIVYYGSVDADKKVITGLPTHGEKIKILLISRNKSGQKYLDTVYIKVLLGSSTVKPNAPSGLAAYGVQKTSAILSWRDNSDNERAFNLYRGDVLIKTLPANTTSFRLSNLAPNTHYSYRVDAVNTAGKSGASTVEFTTRPDALPQKANIISPTNHSTLSGSTLTVQWERNNASRVYLFAYQRYPYKKLLGSYQTGSSVTIENVPTNGADIRIILYSYINGSFKDRDQIDIKEKSAAQTGTPPAPTNLKATNIQQNSATLTWAASRGNQSGYRLYRNTSVVKELPSHIHSYRLTNLAANTKYAYRLVAYNQNGESTAAKVDFRTKSNVIFEKARLLSPRNGGTLKGSRLAIKWRKNSASKVYLSVRQLSPYKRLYGGYLTSSAITLAYLPTNGKKIRIVLYSYDQNLNKGYDSIEVTAEDGITEEKPTPPSNFTAERIQSRTALLVWRDNADNEEGFRLYRNNVLVKTLPSNTSSFKLTGLTPNTKYTYKITSYNKFGDSFASYRTFVTARESSCVSLDELKTKIAHNEDVTHLNTSCITNMRYLFKDNKTFNQDISSWDVSNVIDMLGMFHGASKFNKPIGDWDVSKVRRMDQMFYKATSFNQPIGDWDMSSVFIISNMFSQASSFNQPIGAWDMPKLQYASGVFAGARSFNQPIGDWDMSRITDMWNMFRDASSFNQPIGEWDVSRVTKMRGMFWSASKFNQPIGEWDVSHLTDVDRMFWGARSFNQPMEHWDITRVRDMEGMFEGASSFNQPIQNWDVSGVTKMRYMFSGARSFNQPLSEWDVSGVTTMVNMFKGASVFNQPLATWDVSAVTSMTAMFSGARSFNQPIKHWDVSNVVSHYSFSHNSGLEDKNNPFVGR